jgi:hypothetical protein
MRALSHHAFRPFGISVSVAWVAAFLLSCSGATGQEDASLFSDQRQIIVTVDTSGSMGGFDHEKIRGYVEKILFEGIGDRDLKKRDRPLTKEWVDLFSSALYRPAKDSLFFMRCASGKSDFSVAHFPRGFSRRQLAEHYPRRFSGQTNIAMMIEQACKLSIRKGSGYINTYWVFVSDRLPTGDGENGETQERIRQLEETYRWDLLGGVVIEHRTLLARKKTAFIDVRWVVDRKSEKELSRRIEALIGNMTKSLAAIANDLAEGKDDADVSAKLNALCARLHGLKTQLNSTSLQGATLLLARVNDLLRRAQFARGIRLANPAAGGARVCPEDKQAINVDFEWVRASQPGTGLPFPTGLTFQLECRDAKTEALVVPLQDCGARLQSTLSLPPGQYRWRVVTIVGKERAMETGYRLFTIHPAIGGAQILQPQTGKRCFAGEPVEIRWTKANHASSYVVRVDGAKDIAVAEETVHDPNWLWRPGKTGTYRVSVTAHGPGDQERKVGTVDVAVRSRVAAPELVSPEDGYRCSLPVQPNQAAAVTLVWKRTVGGHADRLQIRSMPKHDPSPVAAAGIERDDEGMSRYVFKPKTPGVFEWTVVVDEGDGTVAAARWRRLAVNAADLPKPTLVGPPEHAQFAVNEDVTLRWSAVPGATSYSVAVTQPGGQEAKLAVDRTATASSVRITRPGDYYWAVASQRASDGATAVSEKRHFSASKPVPEPPVLQSPDDGLRVVLPADGQPPYSQEFSWTPSSGAAKHELVVASQGTEKILSLAPGSASCTVSIPGEQIGQPGMYRWWVRAHADGRVLDSPDPRLLQIVAPPTLRVELVEPDDRAVSPVDAVRFSWKEAEGVKNYTLNVTDAAGESHPYPCGEACVKEVSMPKDGTFSWYLVCTRGDGSSGQSETRSLVILPVVPPVQKSPRDGARPLRGTVRFQWTPPENAAASVIRIHAVDADDAEKSAVVKEETLGVGETEFSCTLDDAGTYNWTVYAKDRLGNLHPAAGGPSSFTIFGAVPFPWWLLGLVLLILLLFLFCRLGKTWMVQVLTLDEIPEDAPKLRLGIAGDAAVIHLDDSGPTGRQRDLAQKEWYLKRSFFGVALYHGKTRKRSVRPEIDFPVGEALAGTEMIVRLHVVRKKGPGPGPRDQDEIDQILNS